MPLSPGVAATLPAAIRLALAATVGSTAICAGGAGDGGERLEERRRVDAAEREAGVVQRVDLLHHLVGQRVELAAIPGDVDVAGRDQPGHPAAADRRGDVGDAAVEPGEAGGRLVLDRHRVGDVGDHQRLAAAERDLHGAVRRDRSSRCRRSDDSSRTTSFCSSRSVIVPLASALAMRSLSDASRLASELISSTEARTRRSASSCACWKRPSVARISPASAWPLRQHVGARGARRRRLRERAEAVEELVQPRVQRGVGRSEARLDDAERFGQRRLAVLRRVLLEQAAIEEAIAEAAHAEHLDAVAGVQALARRRHRAEVDDAARVAGRVDVGDVLAGRVEAVALRVERARRGREHAEEARHQPLACRTPAASVSREVTRAAVAVPVSRRRRRARRRWRRGARTAAARPAPRPVRAAAVRRRTEEGRRDGRRSPPAAARRRGGDPAAPRRDRG